MSKTDTLTQPSISREVQFRAPPIPDIILKPDGVPDLGATLKNLPETFTSTGNLRWRQAAFDGVTMTVRYMNPHGFQMNSRSRYALEMEQKGSRGTLRWVPVPFAE